MGPDVSIAQAVESNDSRVIAQLSRAPLVPRKDNLVPRPWGGDLLMQFKGLTLSDKGPYGESFEISACPGDPEAHAFPSVVRFSDGSEMPLPRLLAVAGSEILGPAFGAGFPLLPKLLDIKEPLSIQGHPPGNIEVYVIIQADPGASLRLGFCRDMPPAMLADRLQSGRAAQHAVAEGVADLGPADLQRLLAPWLAGRAHSLSSLPRELRRDALRVPLQALHDTYWWVLDAMNVIPVEPGQVILNANPARVLTPGQRPAAEVHGLGSPGGGEFLALEIRKPGPTLRAWDHGRFPVRPVDADAAIEALNLKATAPADFMVAKRPLGDQPGVARSVDCDDFCIDHLAVDGQRALPVTNDAVHCLHVLSGAVSWVGAHGSCPLRRGEAAIVPPLAGGYRLTTASAAEVVKVTPKLGV